MCYEEDLAGVGNDHTEEGLHPGTHVCWSVSLIPTQLLPGEDGEDFRGRKRDRGRQQTHLREMSHTNVLQSLMSN